MYTYILYTGRYNFSIQLLPRKKDPDGIRQRNIKSKFLYHRLVRTIIFMLFPMYFPWLCRNLEK